MSQSPRYTLLDGTPITDASQVDWEVISPAGGAVELDASTTYLDDSGYTMNLIRGIDPYSQGVLDTRIRVSATNPGSLTLTLLEGSRVLAVLVHPSQYAGNITGEFYGSGTGVFTQA